MIFRNRQLALPLMNYHVIENARYFSNELMGFDRLNSLEGRPLFLEVRGEELIVTFGGLSS